ncbi:MAG TPA: hypothetical protein VLH85_04405, partial [Levilinea sp.]|nr:hypothetical protein [Levilinea sp.]
MADVRCPHCNSFNPAGAEKCWNCEASLLSGEPTQASIDWLSDLRSGVASQDEGQDDEIEDILGDEDETPDWLKRIRQRSQSEQEFEGSGDLSASSSDDLPDWLIDLQSQPLDEGAASRLGDDAIPPPPGGIDTTGWFQELPGLESGKEAAGGIEDIPTWLLEPPAEPEAEKPSADETAVFSGDLPDWLSAVQKPDQDRADASQAQELPSWLFADEKEERLPEIDSEPGLAAETPVYGTAPNQFEILSHGDRGAQLPVEETPATQEIFDEPVQAYAQDQDAEEADQVSELATSKAFQPGAVEEPAAAVVEEEPDLSVTAFEMDALPDWLAGESVDLPQAEPAASTPAFTVGGEEGLEEPVI